MGHVPKNLDVLFPSLGGLEFVSGYSGAQGFFLPSQIAETTDYYREVPFPCAI